MCINNTRASLMTVARTVLAASGKHLPHVCVATHASTHFVLTCAFMPDPAKFKQNDESFAVKKQLSDYRL